MIVPEQFARRFWPGESAVGRRFRNTSDQWYRIVGVNKRVRYDSDRLGQPSTVEYNIFTPAKAPSLQADTSKPATGRESWAVGIDLVIRLSDLARISDVVQAARSVDSRLLVTGDVVDAVYRDVLSDTRAATTVVSCVGVLAFLIATGGVYGVMMFLVVRREREIGIRMALGADRHVVARHIFGSTLRFVIAGGTAGLACSITLSRFAQSQLFGVSPTDPLTYSAVTAAMIATAMVATWAPARAAARVDPAKTLRGE